MTIEIVNLGAQTGVLQFLELQVRGPSGSTDRFEWSQFYRYSQSSAGLAVEKEFDSHPISLQGKSGRSLSVQFVLRPEAPEDYMWSPGVYEAVLRGWYGKPSREFPPNIGEEFSFYVEDRSAEMLNLRLKVDIIVAAPTPAAAAAKHATGTIPIVMISVGDPVVLGFIASLARPGGSG